MAVAGSKKVTATVAVEKKPLERGRCKEVVSMTVFADLPDEPPLLSEPAELNEGINGAKDVHSRASDVVSPIEIEIMRKLLTVRFERYDVCTYDRSKVRCVQQSEVQLHTALYVPCGCLSCGQSRLGVVRISVRPCHGGLTTSKLTMSVVCEKHQPHKGCLFRTASSAVSL